MDSATRRELMERLVRANEMFQQAQRDVIAENYVAAHRAVDAAEIGEIRYLLAIEHGVLRVHDP